MLLHSLLSDTSAALVSLVHLFQMTGFATMAYISPLINLRRSAHKYISHWVLWVLRVWQDKLIVVEVYQEYFFLRLNIRLVDLCCRSEFIGTARRDNSTWKNDYQEVRSSIFRRLLRFSTPLVAVSSELLGQLRPQIRFVWLKAQHWAVISARLLSQNSIHLIEITTLVRFLLIRLLYSLFYFPPIPVTSQGLIKCKHSLASLDSSILTNG